LFHGIVRHYFVSFLYAGLALLHGIVHYCLDLPQVQVDLFPILDLFISLERSKSAIFKRNQQAREELLERTFSKSKYCFASFPLAACGRIGFCFCFREHSSRLKKLSFKTAFEVKLCYFPPEKRGLPPRTRDFPPRIACRTGGLAGYTRIFFVSRFALVYRVSLTAPLIRLFCRLRQEKMPILEVPCSGYLETLLPLPQSLYGPRQPRSQGHLSTFEEERGP